MRRQYKYTQLALIVFLTIIVILFVQHHFEFKDIIPAKTNPEIYFPPESSARGQKTSKTEFQQYLINVRLSDDIPVNRDVPDSRPDGCNKTGKSRLTASVVITFYQEWPSVLLRTIYSVINRSQNVKQIILVDDGNHDSMYNPVLEHINSKFGELVQIVTLPRRMGLIGARLEGVKHATGDVLCFLDSHIEVNRNWLIPLLKVLEERPKAVAMSQLDYIQSGTFKYEFSKTYRTRYGFDWRMQFFETEFRPEQLQGGDFILPGVIAVGTAFAVRTDFFKEIGMYDPGLKVWGGENFELSFKAWLCGGELLHVTCSRVGHIARSQPYLQKNRLDVEVYNYKRVVDVWMEQYVQHVYDFYPGMKKIQVGDLSMLKTFRRRCRPFTWFLNNVWPELFPYRESTQFGSIMNRMNGSDVCLDNQNHLFSSARKLDIEQCNSDLSSQLFGITDDERLRTHLQCVFVREDVLDLVPYIQNCLQPPVDTFMYKETGEIVYKPKKLCLTIMARNLVFEKCRGTANQLWTFVTSTS